MSKRDLLKWTFGDEGPQQVRAEQSRRISVWRGLLLAAAFFAALGAAGLGGFLVGRYQQAYDSARVDLQNVVDLEGWAWQQGDDNLLRSLLDPAAGRKWRSDIQQQFEAAPRVTRQATIESLSLYGDMARVTLKVVEGSQVRREIRYYRLVNGQWRRTAPE